MKHTVLITGVAGYVGVMLAQKFVARDDVELVIGLDKEFAPAELHSLPKFAYIQRNLGELSWEEELAKYEPDIVIHCAWQIREMYGRQHTQWEWNVGGSERIFKYAFRMGSVRRLVYYSTVSSYGAYPDNTIEHRFTEDEPFRESDYLYAEEKRVAEAKLHEMYEKDKEKLWGKGMQIAIIRPAAITGPRGRFMRIRFSLQATIAGTLPTTFINRIIMAMVSVVPVTKWWSRQFVHEDDMVDITELLAFKERLNTDYEIFNACPPPPGDVVRSWDMAKAVGKRTFTIAPWMVRIAFFFAWHLTQGAVPTARGGWKYYTVPILVDGSKITREYGFNYRMSCIDAFYYTDGRYAKYVPEGSVRSKETEALKAVVAAPTAQPTQA